jgi:hypothetical protein
MTDRKIVSVKDLHNMLVCDSDNGKLYWRHRPECGPRWNGRYPETEAFTYKNVYGYRTGRINRVLYQAHRVVWAMCNMSWPEHEIDHINGIRDDNRISNLRPATRSENSKNISVRSDNTSGQSCIVWHKGASKWMVRVADKYIGVFPEINDAILARDAAWRDMGFHANHGRTK